MLSFLTFFREGVLGDCRFEQIPTDPFGSIKLPVYRFYAYSNLAQTRFSLKNLLGSYNSSLVPLDPISLLLVLLVLLTHIRVNFFRHSFDPSNRLTFHGGPVEKSLLLICPLACTSLSSPIVYHKKLQIAIWHFARNSQLKIVKNIEFWLF